MPTEMDSLLELAGSTTPITDDVIEPDDTAEDASETTGDDDASVEAGPEEKKDTAADDGEARPAPDADDPFAFLDVEIKRGKTAAKAEASPAAMAELNTARQELEAARAELAAMRNQIAESEGAPFPDMELQNPDSPKYDPDEYNRQVFKYQKNQTDKMTAQQRIQIEQRAAAEQFVAERDAEVFKRMPFLFQGEKGEKAILAIRSEAMRNGVPNDGVGYLTADMIETFYNSLQWQAAKTARAAAETKASQKDSPKPVKTEKGRGPAADPLVEMYEASR